VDGLNSFLKTVSAPFYPWINWSMDLVKYPINSYEIFFISMILGVGGYIIGSLLTCKSYDLDKLLHRGKYAEGTEPIKVAWTPRTVFKKLIGITSEYSGGDRFIAYLVFFYSIGFNILLLFFGTIIWNAVSPWPDHWWSIRYFITVIILQIITSVCSTVWFLIGGVRDMRQLFIDLENRVADDKDNGQVLKKEQK
ncbi:MAG: sodium:panthothenate symporter, partial [Lentisphaeria bacterium]|nr:sodium:panthothenate symporter [Lentisphaeria bacterium]